VRASNDRAPPKLERVAPEKGSFCWKKKQGVGGLEWGRGQQERKGMLVSQTCHRGAIREGDKGGWTVRVEVTREGGG
jgi:hypothetical protein